VGRQAGEKAGRLVEGLVEYLLDHVDVREVDPHVRHLFGAQGLQGYLAHTKMPPPPRTPLGP